MSTNEIAELIASMPIGKQRYTVAVYFGRALYLTPHFDAAAFLRQAGLDANETRVAMFENAWHGDLLI